jgi:hypothetical protein
MSDTPESNPYRSATDRARDRWMHVRIEDRYAAGTQDAVDARRRRALAAGREAVILAQQLSDPDLLDPPPDLMWSVRGEPRSRETFGRPHPDDFPGGLPLPAR